MTPSDPVDSEASGATSKAFPESGHPHLLDRDHSLMAFNERVFSWATRTDVPVLERLRYLCIVSSNLDEFFEVRAAPHLTAKRADDRQGSYSVRSFERLSVALHALVARQYALYNESLLPALEQTASKSFPTVSVTRPSATGSSSTFCERCALC